MRATKCFSSFFAAVFCACFSICFARSATGCVGIIERIAAPAYLRLGDHGPPKRLRANQHIGMRLYGGEYLRCDPGGVIKINLGGKPILIEPSPEWFPIPHTPSPASQKMRTAMELYGALGGGVQPITRTSSGNGELVVFSPAYDGVVRPERLVFRWNSSPNTPRVTLALEVQDENLLKNSRPPRKELWRQDHSDAAKMNRQVDMARMVLAKTQASNDERAIWLIVLGEKGSREEIPFFLLSKTDASQLATDLLDWEGESPLMRRVGRIALFSERNLLNEVADECDQALIEFPESEDFLEIAIHTHWKIRNLRRVAELQSRLRSMVRLQ